MSVRHGLDYEHVLALPDGELEFAVDVLNQADKWRTADLEFGAARTAVAAFGGGRR